MHLYFWHSVIHLSQSSLLQALIGEMRKTRGQVRLWTVILIACVHRSLTSARIVYFLVHRRIRPADTLDHERDAP